MNLFEFLMILLSIIVGLGLAEILTGVARLLRDGRQAEFSWVHSAVVITILLALFQVFWESWTLVQSNSDFSRRKPICQLKNYT